MLHSYVVENTIFEVILFPLSCIVVQIRTDTLLLNCFTRSIEREKSLLLQLNQHLWHYQITELSVFQLLSIILLLGSQQTSLSAILLYRTRSHILSTR